MEIRTKLKEKIDKSDKKEELNKIAEKEEEHWSERFDEELLHPVWLHNKVLEGKTIRERLETAFQVYSNRRCIGKVDRKKNEYSWIDYKDAQLKSGSLASFLQYLVPVNSSIGICALNSIEV
jgi:hypothetical protein